MDMSVDQAALELLYKTDLLADDSFEPDISNVEVEVEMRRDLLRTWYCN